MSGEVARRASRDLIDRSSVFQLGSGAVRVLGAVMLVSVAVMFRWKSGLNPDVAFFVEVARRAREGTPLYLDAPGSFVEVNPPLVVWMLVPAIWLARRLGLLITAAPAILVAAEALIGIGLSIAIVRRGPREVRSLPWLIAIAGLVLPIHDFAQREHQLMLLLAPALVLLAVVPSREGVSRWTRIAVGLSAGLGLSLKPHFVLAWVLIEVAVAALDRRPGQLMRLENVLAIAVAAAYAVAVLLLTPDYIRLMSVWGPLYLEMGWKPISSILSGPESIGTIAVLMVALAVQSAGLQKRAALIFAIAAVMFLCGVLVQHKGFNYHYFPGFAFSCVSLLLSISACRRHHQRPLVLMLVGVASVVTLYIIGMRVAAGVFLGREKQRLTTEYSAQARIAGDSGSFVVLSTNLVHSFPMATNMGVRWPIRFPSLWALETAALDGCMPARARYLAMERRFADDLWQDLSLALPAVIVVGPLPASMHPHPGCTSVVDHLSRDPRFAAFFAQYVVADTIPRVVHGPFLVLRRDTYRRTRSQLPPPPISLTKSRASVDSGSAPAQPAR